MRPLLNLASIDLNLMVVFDALMVERHLSRAASRVGLSQPAMSHALRRLRGLLGDELFVRGPGGMEPTPRALALADPIGGALDRLRSALAGEPDFDPATAQRRFDITMSDASSAAILPRLIPRLRRDAPGIDLHLLPSNSSEGIDLLLSGAAELGVGIYPNLSDKLDSAVLTTVQLVCVADANHPQLQDGLTLERFLALPHLAVDIGEDRGSSVGSMIDTMGFKRRIVLNLPYFMVAAGALVGTDLLAVLPAGLVSAAQQKALAIHPLPLPMPDVGLRMAWNARHSNDPALLWLRGMVQDAVTKPPPDS